MQTMITVLLFEKFVLRFKNHITGSTDGDGNNMQTFPLETEYFGE